MNCCLYCIPSYEQVCNVKQCVTSVNALSFLLTSAWQGPYIPFWLCLQNNFSSNGEQNDFLLKAWTGDVHEREREILQERWPLTEKMSSPNSRNPILSDEIFILRDHLVLYVFFLILSFCHVFSSTTAIPCYSDLPLSSLFLGSQWVGGVCRKSSCGKNCCKW